MQVFDPAEIDPDAIEITRDDLEIWLVANDNLDIVALCDLWEMAEAIETENLRPMLERAVAKVYDPALAISYARQLRELADHLETNAVEIASRNPDEQ